MLLICAVSLFVILMFVLKYIDKKTVEKFANINYKMSNIDSVKLTNCPNSRWKHSKDRKLLKKVFTPQGSQVPLDPYLSYNNNLTDLTVEGNKKGPNSLFIFKNNQCLPECCPSTYSCSGGCVCTTDKQRKFITN